MKHSRAFRMLWYKSVFEGNPKNILLNLTVKYLEYLKYRLLHCKRSALVGAVQELLREIKGRFNYEARCSDTSPAGGEAESDIDKWVHPYLCRMVQRTQVLHYSGTYRPTRYELPVAAVNFILPSACSGF